MVNPWYLPLWLVRDLAALLPPIVPPLALDLAARRLAVANGVTPRHPYMTDGRRVHPVPLRRGRFYRVEIR